MTINFKAKFLQLLMKNVLFCVLLFTGISSIEGPGMRYNLKIFISQQYFPQRQN